MKVFNCGGHTLKLYDSVDEMPISNFQKFNKFLLIDAGIGSDVNDIDAHIVKIAGFIKTKNTKKAMQELQNMRQALYMINSKISPKYMAFAALMHSLDGKELTDLSDDGLKSALDSLKNVKHSFIVEALEWLKKKVSTELDLYFPGEFTSAKEKEAYDRIKIRTLLVLDSIVNEADNDQKIEALDIALLNMHNPKSYSGANSAEIEYDKQFESACLLISQKTNTDAKNMTVLQFYNALDIIKKQVEAKSKALQKHKRKRR